MPITVDPSQVQTITVDPNQISAPTSSFDAFKSQLLGFINSAGNPKKYFDDVVTGAGDAVRRLYTDPNQGTPEQQQKYGGKISIKAPLSLAHDMAEKNAVALTQAEDAWKRGDYAAAAAHFFNYLAPFGSTLNDQTTKIEQGKVGEAMGDAVRFGTEMAAPSNPAVRKAVSKLANLRTPKFTNVNPAEVEAVEFGQQRGIDVDAATATGNKFVATAQKAADHSPIGAVVEQNARQRQAEQFKRVGNEIADQSHPTAVAPAQAGRDVAGDIEERIQSLDQEADRHYSALRELEQDPANLRNVQTGTKQVPAKDAKTGQIIPDKFTTEAVMEDVPLPVDMREVKQQLKPVYAQITRQMPITQQRGSTGLKALDNIINGPDAAPASQVDMDLSAIKAAARGADLPELRTLSQGLAAQAVSKLHEGVSEAFSRAERTPPGGLQNAPEAAPVPAPAEPAAADTGGSQQGAAVQQSPRAGAPSAGPQTRITVPGESTEYPGRYEIRELSEIAPSHSGQTFNPNPRYAYRNDRNYTNPVNQRKIVEWSTPEKFDPAYHITNNPDATNGPPIVDQRGNVLGGNGRGMIMDRVYATNETGAAAYRQMLEERAPIFGIDPAEVAKYKQPVLVRVLDDAELTASKAQNAITDFNKVGTAGLTPAEQAISDSRRVSPETLDYIGSELDRFGHDATLAQVIEGKGGLDLMHRLIEDGVVSPQESAKLMTDTELTRAGKERVSQLMLGRFFKTPEQIDSMAAAARGKLERIAPNLARLESEGDYSLTPHIQQAIDLLDTARAHNLPIDDYLNQSNLLARQQFTPEAIELAKQLKDVNPNELTARVRSYMQDAQYAGSYEGPGIFGDMPEPKTPRAAFNDAFKTELKDQPRTEPVETPAAPAKSAGFDESFKPAAEPQKPTAPPLGARVGSPAGDEALARLAAGRAATRAKYDAAAVLKKLPTKGEEGAQVFSSLTWAKDAGIEQLRKVAREAPGQIPRLARAYIEDMLKTATEQGGFGRGGTLWNRWQQLGPETKEILFPNPMQRHDLDRFFLLAKKVAESPNPSGTALSGSALAMGTWAIMHPVTGVPANLAVGAVAKMLHSPRGVAALTNGLMVPLANKAAAALAAERILRIASEVSKAPAEPAAGGSNPSQSIYQLPRAASQ